MPHGACRRHRFIQTRIRLRSSCVHYHAMALTILTRTCVLSRVLLALCLQRHAGAAGAMTATLCAQPPSAAVAASSTDLCSEDPSLDSLIDRWLSHKQASSSAPGTSSSNGSSRRAQREQQPSTQQDWAALLGPVAVTITSLATLEVCACALVSYLLMHRVVYAFAKHMQLQK
jgi:hypothetical protein